MINDGNHPDIRLISIADNPAMMDVFEQRLIRYYRDIGCHLTNLSIGGNGWVYGQRHKTESIKKMSDSKIGNTNMPKGPRPSEVGRKISETKMGHPVLPETRQKLSEANIGKVGELSPSFDASISNSLLKELWERGLSNPEIAIEVGKGQKFVRNRLKLMGLPYNKAKEFSGELSHQFDHSVPNYFIQSLLDDGVSIIEISKQIGKYPEFVYQRIKAFNLRRK